MNTRPFSLSIIIPTKNRERCLSELLESLRRVAGSFGAIRSEIIVADNGSDDGTYNFTANLAKDFPIALRVLRVVRPGKSAAINDAVKAADGDVYAFLDDDVIVDENWLTAVEEFFRTGAFEAGQGAIRVQATAENDSDLGNLVERYRTIPRLEHSRDVTSLHSLNGANFFVSRNAFERVGSFDERLGPGASGTSEDVDFARRLIRAGIAIGYTAKAMVYHHVDRQRLTEEYFKQIHWKQGRSRFLLRKRSAASILFNLTRVATEYALYTLLGKERRRYRSKGRIYHYLGMLDAQRRQSQVDRS